MIYLVAKALHLVAVVAWFAGLFYIVRLFVYLAETQDRPQAEQDVLLPQLQLMARRLWFGITWPAAVAAGVCGGVLLSQVWPPAPWLHLKLTLVAGLYGYHLWCHRLHAGFQRGERPMSAFQLRVFNEVATLFLVAIVFLAVMKSALAPVYAAAGLTVFGGVLMAAILVYRRMRQRG